MRRTIGTVITLGLLSLPPTTAHAGDTATPIKHVIVLLGENRSFDHLFGTFIPAPGQRIWNLWALNIMNPDGSTGPNVGRARQWQAIDNTTYSIHPQKTSPYGTLPAISLGSPPPTPPFISAAAAEAVEPALPSSAYDLLTFNGSHPPNGLSADPRFPRLANGPVDVLGYVSNDDYINGPVHRFYQMWQQLDCDLAAATLQNPSGCQNDLFPWVEATSAREGAASMEIYNSAAGLSPYFQQLATTYALADNYHQAALGGTGTNHTELFYGSLIFYANPDGTPGVPPPNQIENPDPQAGSNNSYTQDGYTSGSYTNCFDLTQPGVASVRSYLASLPYQPFHGCYPGEYYLLNNYAPGYLGSGARAPLGSAQFTAPPTQQPHLGMLLDRHGVSWKYYGEGWANGAESGENHGYCDICNGFLYSTQTMTDPVARATHLKDIEDLYADIQQGALPAVAFVKPDAYLDGHPGSSKWDLFEEFSRRIIEMVQANPAVWADTAVLITADESGGYWDSGYIQPLDFFGDGPRVPLLVVSNRSQGVGIVHTYYDHVSIDKFIEHNWQLNDTISPRSRDNLPNPITDPANPYVPTNSPAIGDLFELFGTSAPASSPRRAR